MAESVFTLPVSLEQVADLIKRMSPAERQQLLNFVPELRQEAMRTERTENSARETVKRVQREVEQILSGQLLSPNEPFLENLTLEQYLKLPEAERARLWDKWSSIELETLEELEVRTNAVPAR